MLDVLKKGVEEEDWSPEEDLKKLHGEGTTYIHFNTLPYGHVNSMTDPTRSENWI